MTADNRPFGRRPSRLVVALQNAATAVHVLLYRSTGGTVGGKVYNAPVLLLMTRGRKTGKQRTVPLLYLKDGDDVVLVASNGGALRHPTWWLNLQADPEPKIQIGRVQYRVKAEQASVAEKQRLWPLLTAMYPGYKKYQEITNRDIPVVFLRRLRS